MPSGIGHNSQFCLILLLSRNDNIKMVRFASDISPGAPRSNGRRDVPWTFARHILFPFCGLTFFCLITGNFMLAGNVPVRTASPQQTSGSDSGPLPCTALDKETTVAKKSAKHKKKDLPRPQLHPGLSCLELRWPPLAVQERLQEFVRAQNWRVGDEDVSESTWTFSRELSPEELLEFASPDPALEPVHWKSGKALVLIVTTDLGEGLTRVTVSGQFEGFGRTDDKFAMQRASWKLNSNGNLESLLINVLQRKSRADH